MIIIKFLEVLIKDKAFKDINFHIFQIKFKINL